MKPGIPLLWRKTEERYNLIGTKCETCNAYYMPARVVCPSCRRKGKISKYKFKGTGKIYSHTIVRVAPEDYEYELPYILSIVELDEGARIMAQITDCDVENVKDSMDVEVVFRKIHDDYPDGLITYGFKFRPIL
jgi:uncharacterized protein